METVEVVVTNMTGSKKQVGILYLSSGIIKIGDEFTHIAYEKTAQSSVVVNPSAFVENKKNKKEK